MVPRQAGKPDEPERRGGVHCRALAPDLAARAQGGVLRAEAVALGCDRRTRDGARDREVEAQPADRGCQVWAQVMRDELWIDGCWRWC